VGKQARSTSLYHSRQCGIVLKSRSNGRLLYDARLQIQPDMQVACVFGSWPVAWSCRLQIAVPRARRSQNTARPAVNHSGHLL